MHKLTNSNDGAREKPRISSLRTVLWTVDVLVEVFFACAGQAAPGVNLAFIKKTDTF